MKLQNILDLSTFEITRFRIWNQTSQPSDKGLGSKYFNTNSGHEAYGREQIYTPIGWRTAAYMDDIDSINEKLDLIFGDEIDTDTIIDSWKEVQDFLSGIEDTTTLMTMLNGKLDKDGGKAKNLAIVGSGTSYLAFESTDGTSYGSLGISSAHEAKFWDGTGAYTLLHSGNVGEYALKTDGSNAMLGGLKLRVILEGSSELADDSGLCIYRGSSSGWEEAKLPYDYCNVFSIAQGYSVLQLGWRRDGNIKKLCARTYASNIWSAWKTIAFTDSDITGYAAGLKHSNGTVGAIVNSSGKVGIGTTTPQYKLDVAGDAGFSGLANLIGGALIPTGKNMMFGDASGNAIMEYDADANAIKVTGNFYATGTVASGGKAQEGTGTGGSATVYPFTLTYGQSAYQIANPKSNTNVIVQVYEWNATTSSWDLILTDVNVTASKITVTFGRTTTVNHMVTVV